MMPDRTTSALPWRLAAIVAVGLGVVPAALGQFKPPFHVPIHEYTQLFVLIGAFVQLNLSAVLVQRTQAGPDRAASVLWLALAAVGLAGISTLGVHALANSWLHHCDTTWTSSYFWIVWLPVGALMSVIGVHAGEVGWGWKRRVGVCMTLIVVGLAHDIAQLMAGVRVFDLFLGEPLSFMQRNAMADIQPIHFLNRAWLLLAAAACWGLSLALRRRGRLVVAVLGAAWLMMTFVGGSRIGIGPGRGLLEQTLDQVHETPHFVFRVNGRGHFARFKIESAGRRAEWIYSKLAPACGIESQARIEVAVFDGNWDLEKITGMANAHAYYRWIRLSSFQLNTDTLTHELVHALCTPNRWRLLWGNRAIVEGSASAWERGLTESPFAHAEAAGALRAGKLPSIADVASEFGFRRIEEFNAYRTSASFIGFLVLTRGLERFQDLQRTQDIEKTYGVTLPDLEEQWHAFLLELPEDLDVTASSRARFDPIRARGYLDEACPKLESCQMPPERDAAARLRAGDADGSERIYRLLAVEDPERWTASWVVALQRLERFDEALSAIDGYLRGAIADDQRLVMLDARVSLQMASGRWEQLDATFAERASLTGEVSAERSAIEEGLRDPAMRESLATILLASEDGWSKFLARAELLELSREHPDRQSLGLLVATWARVGYPIYPTPTSLRILNRTVARLIATPGACDQVPDQLASIAHAYLDSGACAKAADLIDALDSACVAPKSRWFVEDIKRRLAWERIPDLPMEKPCAAQTAAI